MEGWTTYTIDEAAVLLRETPERVLEMLHSGHLHSIGPGAGSSGQWKVLLPTSLGEGLRQEAPAEESSEGTAEYQDETPAASGEEEAQAPPEMAETGSDERIEPADPAARPDTGAAPVIPPGAPLHESPREPDEVARSDAGESGWTTTKQAAKVLGVSRRSVQGYVRRGLLEARERGEGVNKTFLVDIDSLNTLRDRRSREASAAAKFVEASEDQEWSASLYANAGEALRHAIERVEARTAEATELRVRLEITEQAESTLRAELEAERRRLEEERRRREAAERERDDLRRRLEVTREARESPARPAPETPTTAGGGAQEAREATQPQATAPGPQVDPQRPPQPGRRRGALWRRVFGR